MAELRRRETLTTRLVTLLTDRIADGTYPRGEKLPSEQEMIDEFGVSRTVVREAIATLKAGGLVSTHQGVGAFVLQAETVPPFRIEETQLDVVREVLSVLELRIGFEAEAAALAAQRRQPQHLAAMRTALDQMKRAIAEGEDAVEADLAFHRAIAEATENKHFLNFFNYLGALLIPRTRLQTFRFHDQSRAAYLERVNGEHDAIYYAIERQDGDSARAAMRVHLAGSRERLRVSLREGSAAPA